MALMMNEESDEDEAEYEEYYSDEEEGPTQSACKLFSMVLNKS